MGMKQTFKVRRLTDIEMPQIIEKGELNKET